LNDPSDLIQPPFASHVHFPKISNHCCFAKQGHCVKIERMERVQAGRAAIADDATTPRQT